MASPETPRLLSAATMRHLNDVLQEVEDTGCCALVQWEEKETRRFGADTHVLALTTPQRAMPMAYYVIAKTLATGDETIEDVLAELCRGAHFFEGCNHYWPHIGPEATK